MAANKRTACAQCKVTTTDKTTKRTVFPIFKQSGKNLEQSTEIKVHAPRGAYLACA